MLQISYPGVSQILCIALTASVLKDFDLLLVILLSNTIFFSIIASVTLHYVQNEKIRNFFSKLLCLLILLICSTLWLTKTYEVSSVLVLECVFIKISDTQQLFQYNLSLYLMIQQSFYAVVLCQDFNNYLPQLSLIIMLICAKIIFFLFAFQLVKKKSQMSSEQNISQLQLQNRNDNCSFSDKQALTKEKQRNESFSLQFYDKNTLLKTIKDIYQNQQILIVSDNLSLIHINFDLQIILKDTSIIKYQEYQEFLNVKCKYLDRNNHITVQQVMTEILTKEEKYSFVKLRIEDQVTENVILQIIYFSETKNLLLHIVKYKNTSKIQKNIHDNLLIDICRSLSHNLGTNLNSIQTFSNYALEDHSISSLIKGTYITPIHTNSLQLNLIISNLRDYNLIKLNQFDLNLEQFSLKQEILLIQDLFNEAIERRKIKILNYFNDIIIFNDPNRFRQVYFQIFQNAVKFTESGVIKTQIILFNNHQDNWQYQITVTDTGIGMNKSEHIRLENIIQSGEFLRVSKNSVGSGFGINISNLLVKFLSGTEEPLICEPLTVGCRFVMKLKVFNPEKYILIEKQNDQGVKVFRSANSYFEKFESLSISSQLLDKRLSHMDASPKMKNSINESLVEIALANLEQYNFDIQQLPQFSPKLIQNINNTDYITINNECCSKFLLVDDEVFNITCLTMILRKYTSQTDSAFNGREALQKIKQKMQFPCKICQNQYYQFIFLDINMPVLDGIETAEQIQKLTEQKVIQKPWIIGNSGFCDLQTKLKAYDAGFDHYLTKPIDQHRLQLIVEQLMQKNEEKNQQIIN